MKKQDLEHIEVLLLQKLFACANKSLTRDYKSDVDDVSVAANFIFCCQVTYSVGVETQSSLRGQISTFLWSGIVGQLLQR